MGDIADRLDALIALKRGASLHKESATEALWLEEAKAEIVTLRERAESAERARDEALRRVQQMREVNKASLMVLCAIRDGQSWSANMLKDIDFAIEANRAVLSPSPVST